ncbi:hypothetical protein H9P43_002354 [Blastocladiella emersonii ATCC 22665]|nr:hypothetical protein H9P43_002354 [Blastocladiella emersonii ATCC 22665]
MSASTSGRDFTLLALGASFIIGLRFVETSAIQAYKKPSKWAYFQLAAAVFQLLNQCLSAAIQCVSAASLAMPCNAFLQIPTTAYILFQLTATSVLIMRSTCIVPTTWSSMVAATPTLVPSAVGPDGKPVATPQTGRRRSSLVDNSALHFRRVTRSPRLVARVVLFALFAIGMALIAHSSYLKLTFINAAGRCASTQLWSNNVGKLLLCVVHGGVLFIFARPLISHLRRASRSGFAASATTLRRLLRDQTMRLSVAIFVYLLTSILGLAGAVDPSVLYVLFSAQNAAGMWAACAAAAATTGGGNDGSTSSSNGGRVTTATNPSTNPSGMGTQQSLAIGGSTVGRRGSSPLLNLPQKAAVGASYGRVPSPAVLGSAVQDLNE